jgi:hypothetical protein
MIEGSGSGYIPLTNGSVSRRHGYDESGFGSATLLNCFIKGYRVAFHLVNMSTYLRGKADRYVGKMETQ